MSKAMKKGERGHFWMRDIRCIGLHCFAPGKYSHRAPTVSGSRNTGSISMTCLTNAYRGCPTKTEFSAELAATHKAEGWKIK